MNGGAYDRSVFINCPFDAAHQPIFHAILFAVHDCGFHARTALEPDDGGEARMTRTLRIIGECRYGVHDISRVPLDAGSGLPNFDVPFRLGLFLAAQRFGLREQKTKRSVVLDVDRYRYQVSCTDLAGQDVRAHANDPVRAVAAVRSLLATALGGRARVPGTAAIAARYGEFRAELPELCEALFLATDALEFVELRSLMAVWLARHPLGTFTGADDPWDAEVPFDSPLLAASTSRHGED